MGEFLASSSIEKEKREGICKMNSDHYTTMDGGNKPRARKLSCMGGGNILGGEMVGTTDLSASQLRYAVVQTYSLISASLLLLQFTILTLLPEPPCLSPRRGVTRKWRRERFLERCIERKQRLLEMKTCS